MYSKLYGKILFPFYETILRKRNTLKYLQYLEKTQWLPLEKVKEIQWGRLQELIKHAYENVPYYKKIFDELKLRPEDIRTNEDFEKLPFLTKQDIRNHYNELLSNNHNKVFNTATGGSTGVPVHLALDHNNYEWRQAVAKRAYGWTGYKDGERTVYIWGGSVGNVSLFKKLKHDLDEKLRNHKIYNTFYFTEKVMSNCLQEINSFRPNFMVAYTTPLYNFARYIKNSNKRIYSPKSIIAAAEKIYPFQRELIEETFGCPVFETYGCREVTSIAGECEKHKGMHINAENLYIEIVKENKLTEPGETGEIVITDLTNYCMPLIRYKNEDLGSFSREICSCGRGLPLIEKIEGRLLDTIQTKDGKVVPGEFFPHLMKEFRTVKQFQVIQESFDKLTIKIVKTEEFNHEAVAFMKKEIIKIMGSKIMIDFQFVQEIPLTKTGKFRVVTSKIPFIPKSV